MLQGSVSVNRNRTTVHFEYGLTTGYGVTAPALPAVIEGRSFAETGTAMADLAPATTYHYRVNAVNVGGITEGADRTFTTLSVLQQWRQRWFDATANAASAADLNDLDSDGLVNLLEFAFGQNLRDPVSAALPGAQAIGNQLVIGFTQPAGVSGIILKT